MSQSLTGCIKSNCLHRIVKHVNCSPCTSESSLLAHFHFIKRCQTVCNFIPSFCSIWLIPMLITQCFSQWLSRFSSFFADIDVNWCIPTIAHCFTESTHAGRVCPPLWVHSTLTLSDSSIIFYSRLICLNHLYSFWTWFPPLPPILPPLALFLCFAKVSVDTNSV